MAAELLRNFLGRLAGYGRSEEYAGESYEDNMDEDAEAEDGNDNVLNADFRTRAAHSAARRGSDSKVVDFNPPRGAYRSVLVNAVPVRYSDAEEICRHLRERHTVIFNLEEVPAELAQKIVDFVSCAL
jgi:cell division inhibitor SepF